MKESLKTIYFGCILLMQSIISLITALLFNKYGVSRKIKLLNNKPKKQAVSIIAGGPSAREIVSERTDLLQNTDLLVLNDFGNTPEFFMFKPRYYILLDPAYFFEDFHEKLDEKNVDEDKTQEHLLVDNLKKVDWEMMLFMPVESGGKLLGRDVDNPCIKVLKYNKTRISGYKWFQNWMYAHNQGVPSSRNIIIPAMILMANIGYKEQYLYGCEFSWTKTMDVDLENGMMFFNDRHFYSKSEIRYFGKGGYKWWLKAIYEMVDGVDSVANYAESIGVNIINRSKGSFIDAFTYQNPDKL